MIGRSQLPCRHHDEEGGVYDGDFYEFGNTNTYEIQYKTNKNTKK